MSQDPEASADVFMFANDTLTTMTDANALAKFGGKYREEIESTNSQEVLDSLIMDGDLYGVPFTTNTWFMYYDKSVFSEEDVKNLDTMLEKGVPETADFLLRCPEGDSVLYELISGKRIACKKQDGMLSFSLTIPSASGAILALYPAEPEKMEIEGTTLKSVFRRGLQVVKITETDAAGKEGDYNGYYLAENGLLKLPPRDFPAGQLEIRELTTGERMLIHGENPGGARSSARHDPQ